MKRFRVYSKNKLIGETDLEHHDDGMGVAFGKLDKSNGYESVRAKIRLLSDATPVSGHDDYDEGKLKKYYKALLKLKLTVKDQHNTVLPTDHVSLEDWEEEAGEGEINVQAILSDRDSYPGALA